MMIPAILNSMSTSNGKVSACRHCQFYQLHGRRGGHCQQLNVSVQGCWTPCPLAIPPFAPIWEAPVQPVLAQEGAVLATPPIKVELELIPVR